MSARQKRPLARNPTIGSPQNCTKNCTKSSTNCSCSHHTALCTECAAHTRRPMTHSRPTALPNSVGGCCAALTKSRTIASCTNRRACSIALNGHWHGTHGRVVLHGNRSQSATPHARQSARQISENGSQSEQWTGQLNGTRRTDECQWVDQGGRGPCARSDSFRPTAQRVRPFHSPPESPLQVSVSALNQRRTSERRSGSGSSVAVRLWSSRSSSAGAETFMRSCLHHRPIRMRRAGHSPIRSGARGQASGWHNPNQIRRWAGNGWQSARGLRPGEPWHCSVLWVLVSTMGTNVLAAGARIHRG